MKNVCARQNGRMILHANNGGDTHHELQNIPFKHPSRRFVYLFKYPENDHILDTFLVAAVCFWIVIQWNFKFDQIDSDSTIKWLTIHGESFGCCGLVDLHRFQNGLYVGTCSKGQWWTSRWSWPDTGKDDDHHVAHTDQAKLDQFIYYLQTLTNTTHNLNIIQEHFGSKYLRIPLECEIVSEGQCITRMDTLGPILTWLATAFHSGRVEWIIQCARQWVWGYKLSINQVSLTPSTHSESISFCFSMVLSLLVVDTWEVDTHFAGWMVCCCCLCLCSSNFVYSNPFGPNGSQFCLVIIADPKKLTQKSNIDSSIWSAWSTARSTVHLYSCWGSCPAHRTWWNGYNKLSNERTILSPTVINLTFWNYARNHCVCWHRTGRHNRHYQKANIWNFNFKLFLGLNVCPCKRFWLEVNSKQLQTNVRPTSSGHIVLALGAAHRQLKVYLEWHFSPSPVWSYVPIAHLLL